MNEQDYEQLTLFPAGSHASHSPRPDSAEARRMTATSGLRCCELLRSCGPLGSLERMLLTSSIWRSTMCFLTWKAKATPRGRLWFQLAASALHTNDTDMQSWPTPTAMDAAGLAGHLRKDATSTRSILLSQKVKCLAEGGHWKPEPGVGRVADGVPRWMDRVRCLGNAVCPPQFYPFFYYIREIEEALHEP